MKSQVNFTVDEPTEVENWNLFGKKPDEISMEKWQLAIGSDVIEEHFGFYENLPNGIKNQRRYNNQRGLILKALKAIEFERRPNVKTDKHGNIYVYFAYGKNGLLIPGLDSQGYLGFFGGGNVCILFAQTNNILKVIYSKVNTRDAVIQTISAREINMAIENNYRIKLSLVNFPQTFKYYEQSDAELLSPYVNNLKAGETYVFSIKSNEFRSFDFVKNDVFMEQSSCFERKVDSIFELSLTVPMDIDVLHLYGLKGFCWLPLIEYEIIKDM
jgi:hypothetical protein